MCRFLFDVPEQDKLVSTLSGGEKCRLLFAKLMCTDANLLVLDEPTNDLDIDSLQTLETAIAQYEGAVLFVTHDRFLINRIATAVLAFDEDAKTFVRYEGDYDLYTLCKKREAEEKAAKQPRETSAKPASRQNAASKPRKLTFKESQEFKTIEDDIMAAEDAKASIESEISNPENYKIPNKIKELNDALAEAEKKVESLYARWEYLTKVANGEVFDTP